MVRMSFAWLVLGALVGSIDGLGSQHLGQIVTGVISGTIVLAVPGLFLGLIGGDVKGSFVGAAGGLLGCLISELIPGVSVPPLGVHLMVVFGALAGASFLLYLQTAVWTYGMIWHTAYRLIGGAPVLEKALSRCDVLGTVNGPRRNSLPCIAPQLRNRFRREVVMNPIADRGADEPDRSPRLRGSE
jgi:hypothetical protein